MLIDIRDDIPDLHDYLRRRVAMHIERSKSEQLLPVSMMTFGFEFGQSNWVALTFDTRAEAEPDGRWSLDIEECLLTRPKWPIWPDLPDDAQVEFIDLQGERIDVMSDPDEIICNIVGETLKHVLLTARDGRAFDELLMTDTCELYVENLEGFYAWPDYDDRKMDNLARRVARPR